MKKTTLISISLIAMCLMAVQSTREAVPKPINSRVVVKAEKDAKQIEVNCAVIDFWKQRRLLAEETGY